MAKTDQELHLESVNRFIAMANEMKDEGIAMNIVSGSLMTAAGLYATYVAAGDKGGLTDSGVDRVSEAFKKELARIQEIKKHAAQAPTAQ